MASEKKLDCVILGLLSHEALTGYEIKKRIDGALSGFWSASYGSIYPTLDQLVKHGYALRRADDTSARGRTIYTITEAGREHLREWLRQPTEKDEMRYETLLRLFFGKEQGAAQTLEHIERFRAKTEEKLAGLLAAKKLLSGHPDSDGSHRYYLLTVEFGIKTYTAYLEWCCEASAALKGE